jgi:hypothetical protein
MTMGWTTSGDFKNTDKFLQNMVRGSHFKDLKRFADEGVQALRDATPRDSGETAAGWYAVVKKEGSSSYRIEWRNRHVVGGAVIAVLIQYGHGTGTGGYVRAVDYVNPAMQPVMDKITERVWKEVTNG